MWDWLDAAMMQFLFTMAMLSIIVVLYYLLRDK